MTVLSRIRRKIWRYRTREDGTVTIEFVILFPAFMIVMMSAYEVGYYSVSSTMMERGLDLAVRDIRLGRMPKVDVDTVRYSVCHYSKFVRNCEDNIHVALEPVDARTFQRPARVAACKDKAANTYPATKFEDGGENELMLVRVCINMTPVFPTAGFGSQLVQVADGHYFMVATAAFVNEPNS